MMLDGAETYRLQKDEELSYVLYFKYFNLFYKIQKYHADYNKNMARIIETVGNNVAIGTQMDELYQLQESLKKRYAELESRKRECEEYLKDTENCPPPTKKKRTHSSTLRSNDQIFHEQDFSSVYVRVVS